MARKEISISYNIFDDRSTLNNGDASLLDQAFETAKNAYAPYSQFRVGVAIRTIDGQIVTGSNQENGSFPIGQCAERVALYRLVHEHGRIPIDTIAIIVENEQHTSPASPCGSCRQILNEYRNVQDASIRLLLGSAKSNTIIEIGDIRDLLPFAFNGLFLGH